jgi:hypothetical protein
VGAVAPMSLDLEFERVFDRGVQKRLHDAAPDLVDLDAATLRRFVSHERHGLLVAPLRPLRVDRTLVPVTLGSRPPQFAGVVGAALLLEFACGSAWSWATADEVWEAALCVARKLYPADARGARHFSEVVSIALAARCGVRLTLGDLPNIDYAALNAQITELDRRAGAAAAAAVRAPTPPPPPPSAPDRDAELSAVEARRALASAIDHPRPSRR